MSENPPCVYLLNGEDEFAISSFLSDIQSKMGDSATAEMNTTRLDGRSFSMDVLVNAVGAMPFLTSRRLVILVNPLVKMNSSAQREKFLTLLDQVPVTTALVLVEYRLLTDDRDRRTGKVHWLEKWALEAGERAFVRTFVIPRGRALEEWILERARVFGGQFSSEAASFLVDQAGDDPRVLDQEIQKILTYVNFNRPVEPDDVAHLTPFSRQGDIFVMVDALANHQAREAQAMLQQLLGEQDAILIFAMVVRQFRLLLLAREVMDRGGQVGDIVRELRISPFVARKLVPQAQRFNQRYLENIYHRLLEIDLASKTSLVEGDLALDMLVVSLTA